MKATAIALLSLATVSAVTHKSVRSLNEQPHEVLKDHFTVTFADLMQENHEPVHDELTFNGNDGHAPHITEYPQPHVEAQARQYPMKTHLDAEIQSKGGNIHMEKRMIYLRNKKAKELAQGKAHAKKWGGILTPEGLC